MIGASVSEAMMDAAASRELGLGIQKSVKVLTRNWRKLVAFELVKEGKTPQLGGVVEGFIDQIGASLATNEPSPGHAWAAARGVLRLSPSRGMLGLFDEFAGLRRVIRDYLAANGSPVSIKRQVDAMLDAAVDSAMTQYKATALPASAVKTPFRGSVVVMFEAPRKPAARRNKPSDTLPPGAVQPVSRAEPEAEAAYN